MFVVIFKCLPLSEDVTVIEASTDSEGVREKESSDKP